MRVALSCLYTLLPCTWVSELHNLSDSRHVWVPGQIRSARWPMMTDSLICRPLSLTGSLGRTARRSRSSTMSLSWSPLRLTATMSASLLMARQVLAPSVCHPRMPQPQSALQGLMRETQANGNIIRADRHGQFSARISHCIPVHSTLEAGDMLYDFDLHGHIPPGSASRLHGV